MQYGQKRQKVNDNQLLGPIILREEQNATPPTLPTIDQVETPANSSKSNLPKIETVVSLKKNNLAFDDDKILTEIFNTRIRQDDGNVKNKQDIHAKKILRSAKEYYEQKLESKLQYKKIRRNLSRLNSDRVMKDWKCFLDYTD